jgi:hypothetical protein
VRQRLQGHGWVAVVLQASGLSKTSNQRKNVYRRVALCGTHKVSPHNIQEKEMVAPNDRLFIAFKPIIYPASMFPQSTCMLSSRSRLSSGWAFPQKNTYEIASFAAQLGVKHVSCVFAQYAFPGNIQEQ